MSNALSFILFFYFPSPPPYFTPVFIVSREEELSAGQMEIPSLEFASVGSVCKSGSLFHLCIISDKL